jgi:MinD superfamily P-loop ATPase
MKIAVCSGKGGTGKTTVATNLAVTASRIGRSTAYLDCDVEEPNGWLFLLPEILQTLPVEVSVPVVDHEKCTACGKCGQICRFSAIVAMGTEVLTFPELCHGCGGCWEVCPVGAVSQGHRRTGQVEIGRAGDLQCVTGKLRIGEAMSPPVIQAVKQSAPVAEMTFLDSPPGTSCPVIASIRGADMVLLVTEPTPFGLNDLKLAVEMVRALALPFAVVINRAGIGDGRTQAFCGEEGIEILSEIPDQRQVAKAYSRGELACDVLAGYSLQCEDLLEAITQRAASEDRSTGPGGSRP